MPLLLLFAAALLALISADRHEYRLYQELLRNYNMLERPVVNHSEAVRVTLSVILQQIVDVDEQNQIIEINAWLSYAWKDYKLNWDPAKYGGVADVRFPVGRIWKPDVLLYNSVDTNFDSTYPSNLVVYSDGTVNWIPPGIFKISCKIDITWFPFDDQSCYLKFGSWTYHGFALDLQPASFDVLREAVEGMDTSEYLTNGEWRLLGTPVNRSEKFYDCCVEPYPDVKFYMQIRRRTLYYGFNLIIPSLLISLMTVLGFTLPPDAGEKITLEITILLSVCFFLSMVASMTPPTSGLVSVCFFLLMVAWWFVWVLPSLPPISVKKDVAEAVPLIGTFFTTCMLVVSASVVFTVVVLNLHYRTPDTHEMSDFTRMILLNWLPWLLMMKRPGHKFSRQAILQAFHKGEETETEGLETETLMENVRIISENGKNAASDPTSVPQPGVHRLGVLHDHRRDSIHLETRIHQCIQPLITNPGLIDPGVHALILMMQRIHGELKFITRRMEKEDEDSDAGNDWKFAAMVVDRLCLVIFSAFIIASTCGIMFSAPHLTA